MKPDDVNIDEVARLVLSELEGEAAPEAAARPEHESALRLIRNEVRELVATLGSDDSVAAPADLVRQTAALLRQRGLAAMIAAVLVYDSRRRQQVGFRSSGARCHMTFDAEGEQIDIHLEPSDGRWRVRGRIGEDRTAASGTVQFVASDGFEVVTVSPIDAVGYFEAEIPADQYDVQISMPDCTILLERVRIG